MFHLLLPLNVIRDLSLLCSAVLYVLLSIAFLFLNLQLGFAFTPCPLRFPVPSRIKPLDIHSNFAIHSSQCRASRIPLELASHDPDLAGEMVLVLTVRVSPTVSRSLCGTSMLAVES
jgi:hypothetical protein